MASSGIFFFIFKTKAT